jgi:hypothetical protein
MTVPKLRDDRLCWLAVRDQLDRCARRGPLMVLAYMAVRRRRYIGTNPRGEKLVSSAVGEQAGRDITGGKMRTYALAVYDVSARLSPDERQVLRTTGQVPDWFLGAVLDHPRTVRKHR